MIADSFDFKSSKSQQVVDNIFKKLEKLGKGIILMHDFQKHTADALPEILRKLKAGGYKVQSSLQDNEIRVTGKKRDDLQAVIGFLRGKDFKVALSFKNFRD